MKQQITKEQLKQLSYKEQKFLLQWKKDFTKNKLFTIGEMLEYIRDTYSNEIEIKIILNRDKSNIENYTILLYKDDEVLYEDNENELCDVLWDFIIEDMK